MFDHLFSPLLLGGLTIPNRICFQAHRTNFAKRRRLEDRHVAYYCRRAKGGAGLIVLGELSIHPNDMPWDSMIEAYAPGVIPDFKKFTDRVHSSSDTIILAQLKHHGFQSSGAVTRQPVWGPSPMEDIVFGENAKAMEPEEIEETLHAFARAAVFAREGEFDGIEIDIGPESLLRQFLSPISNHREDEYGGSLANRMRFPMQVMDQVRKAVGMDYTVGIRLCADERFWGGITLQESVNIAREFECCGKCDFINVSIGTYYNLHLIQASMHTSEGFTVESAHEIKKAVQIPVIVSHQIGFPQVAEEILDRGQADAVGLVRHLICDPDAPDKARKGSLEDIRLCVKDNKGCIGRINQQKALSCTQNPSVGYEDFQMDQDPIRAKVQKKVMVVGGGPAGMEAALSAWERGHDVVLYERETFLGGQVNLIIKRPGRKPMVGIIHHLINALKKSKIPVISGIHVTPNLVSEINPDVVIVATGSRPRKKPLPGDYGPPVVLNVWEALSGLYSIGQKVLFIDENGGHHAAATVELLADQGKSVNMVTSDLFIGVELAPLGDLYLTRQRLLQRGITLTSDVTIDHISGRRVKGQDVYTNEPVYFENYDTIILDMGNEAEEDLYFNLKGKVKELYRIGDCVAPRGIDVAIFEGRRVCETL